VPDEQTIEFRDKEVRAGNRGDARKARMRVARDIKDVHNPSPQLMVKPASASTNMHASLQVSTLPICDAADRNHPQLEPDREGD
jgi:hypothetical protein